MMTPADNNQEEYNYRENLKHEAWKDFSNAKSIEQKIAALEKVILSHWMRSKSASAERKNHPDLFTYSCHWVYASRSQWFGADDQELNEALYKKYPRPNRLRIAKGRTYWEYLRRAPR